MATVTINGDTWNYTDGKKVFDDWIIETPERAESWIDACGEHTDLKLAKGDNVHKAGIMFQSWIDYAGATLA